MPLQTWTERDQLLSDALDSMDRAMGLDRPDYLAEREYAPTPDEPLTADSRPSAIDAEGLALDDSRATRRWLRGDYVSAMIESDRAYMGRVWIESEREPQGWVTVEDIAAWDAVLAERHGLHDEPGEGEAPTPVKTYRFDPQAVKARMAQKRQPRIEAWKAARPKRRRITIVPASERAALSDNSAFSRRQRRLNFVLAQREQVAAVILAMPEDAYGIRRGMLASLTLTARQGQPIYRRTPDERGSAAKRRWARTKLAKLRAEWAAADTRQARSRIEAEARRVKRWAGIA